MAPRSAISMSIMGTAANEQRLKSMYITTQALSLAVLGVTIAMWSSPRNRQAGVFDITYNSRAADGVTVTQGSMYRCSGTYGKERCARYSILAYLDALAAAWLVVSSALNCFLVAKSKERLFSIATAAFTTRIIGCAFLSAALVFVLDSYFGVVGALKPDAEPKVRTGLVFWGHNAVNVAFAVLLLASDIVYRKWTQSRAWSGARYGVAGHGA